MELLLQFENDSCFPRIPAELASEIVDIEALTIHDR